MEMRKTLILIPFLFCLTHAWGQEKGTLEIGGSRHFRLVSVSSGLNPGVNGASLHVEYTIPIQNFPDLKPGLEAGANGISNYLLFSAGIYDDFQLGESRFKVNYGVKTLQGAALFQQKGLYMFGLACEVGLDFKTVRNNELGFFLQPLYINSPAYSDYSLVHSYLDLHVGISYGIQMGKH